MAGHQPLLMFISLMSKTCKAWQTFLQQKSLQRHVHGCATPFIFCPQGPQKRAIRSLGNPLPWGNSRQRPGKIIPLPPSHRFSLWLGATVAMPEELSCLESCRALQSLVIIFPRGTHSCVTKLGAVELECWINCVSSEWNGSIRSFVCLFTCLFSSFSPRMFCPVSQIRAISMSLDHVKIKSWFKIRVRDEFGLYRVISSETRVVWHLTSVLPDSRWQEMALTACMRSSGGIRQDKILQNANNFPFIALHSTRIMDVEGLFTGRLPQDRRRNCL